MSIMTRIVNNVVNNVANTTAMAAVACALLASPAFAQQMTALTGATVHTVEGDPIENGVVIIEGRVTSTQTQGGDRKQRTDCPSQESGTEGH